MAKSGRRGAPPDLKGTLGTLLRTTINQVGALSDVARRSAMTQKQRLDGALLERRRREALADLGEVLYQLLKSGEIELDELPELVQAADEIEELERRIAEAEAETARQRRPVRLTRTERGSAADRGAEPGARGARSRQAERVWRPPDQGPPPKPKPEPEPEPAAPARRPAHAAARRPTPAPAAARRPTALPRPVSEPPPPAARGGITFVEDDPPGDEELEEYMNEADVPERDRKRPAD